MPNGIVPTIKLSMELTKVLADIEMNGLHINTDILTNIKVKFEKELVDLQKYLNDKVKYFMGDTPINLDSPEDRSLLFYSMKVFLIILNMEICLLHHISPLASSNV